MLQRVLPLLIVASIFLYSGQALAKDGWYMGMDVGVALAQGLDVESWDNDVPTQCDKFFNNDGSGNYLVSPGENCDQSSRDASSWIQQFDGGTGFLAGVAVGYRLGSFRVEGEYFYRGTTYDDLDDEVDLLPAGMPFQGGKEGELSVVEGGVDDVLSHNFFANLYYDYRSDSKFTPYVGFGVGFSRVSLDFYNRWTRNYDFSKINTFTKGEFPESEREVRANLNREVAGTTTVGRAKLSDTLFGYQAIVGVDYQVSEPVTIGLKFRWADYGEFEDGGKEWEPLRGHDSAVGPGGARVQYSVATQDIQFWGVSLNMKYQF